MRSRTTSKLLCNCLAVHFGIPHPVSFLGLGDFCVPNDALNNKS